MTQFAASMRSVPARTRVIPRPRLVMVRSIGWLCVLSAALLSVLGAVAIGTVPPAPGETSLAITHVAHLVVGLIAAVAVAVPHYRVVAMPPKRGHRLLEGRGLVELSGSASRHKPTVSEERRDF